ncbi:uncharacterized protein N7479_001787 [Penicillium vulpinum]|uniref:RNase III domain-containing protein n=1 Tax=Penicillium vulpinum TaxID=29845 RepID=A0A1V6RCB5_9EURO|nr:uncharacterized protein N7479_001787 [Penicillium vulpinum]KAJ5971869.1 hypothetical protein N7479_001787 [Penicillium vulpinum]OQD98963.1 hypothetical protein PENVUL_c068G01636 [Penicillium vulpinum]
MDLHYVLPTPSDEVLEVFEKKIKYRFNDRARAREALQAAAGFNGDGNKDLALIGDAILRLVIVNYGYTQNYTKGYISNVITEKANNAYLAKQGFALEINNFVVRNNSQPTVGRKVMAATMEAIVGAVFLDCDQQIAPCVDVMAALGIFSPE